jgi:hypothetical protein
MKTLDGGLPDAPEPMPQELLSGRTAAPALSASASRASRSSPSAPILLTQKKPAAAAGEISARRIAPTPAALSALGDAPTVQVRLDSLPPAASLFPAGAPPVTARGLTPIASSEPPRRSATPAMARDSLRKTPAPGKTPAPASPRDNVAGPSLDALLPTGPDSKAKLKKVLGATRLTPSTAFDAVEADFFAREADLYKREDVDSFDDLDRGRPKRRR